MIYINILKNKNFLLAVFIVGLILIMGFFDLSISKFVYNPDSGVSNFFEKYGQLILPFAVLVSSFGLVRFLIHEKNKKYYFYIFAFLASLLYIILIFAKIKEYSFGFFSVLILFSLAIFITLFSILKLDLKVLRNLKLIFIKIIFAAVISTLVVILLKGLWGRIRFRDIADFNEQFTMWYKINGMNGEFSFPSSHAANVGILYGICYFNINKKYKDIVMLFVFLIIILLSFSRIIIGAHFVTDIIAGIGITIFSFKLMDYILPKQKIAHKS